MLNQRHILFERPGSLVLDRLWTPEFHRGVTVRHDSASSIQVDRKAIGVLVEDRQPDQIVGSPGVSACRSMLGELSRIIAKLGYQVITFPSARKTQTDIGDDVETLDGLVVLSANSTIDDIADLARNLPVIALMQDATAARVPSFFFDMGYHAAAAVQELYARGHRRIALFANSDPSCTWAGNEMRRGYELAHRICDMPMDPGLVFLQPGTPEAGETFYLNLRQSRPDVTAVVVSHAEPAAGMERAAANRREPIPEKVSIVQVANTETGPRQSSCFAHFNYPNAQMARDAVQTLQELIEFGDESDRRMDHLYYGDFIAGQSIRTLA